MASIASFESLHWVSVQFSEVAEYNDALRTAQGTKSPTDGSKTTFPSNTLGQQPFFSATKSQGVNAEAFWRETQAPLYMKEKEDHVRMKAVNTQGAMLKRFELNDGHLHIALEQGWVAQRNCSSNRPTVRYHPSQCYSMLQSRRKIEQSCIGPWQHCT